MLSLRNYSTIKIEDRCYKLEFLGCRSLSQGFLQQRAFHNLQGVGIEEIGIGFTLGQSGKERSNVLRMWPVRDALIAQITTIALPILRETVAERVVVVLYLAAVVDLPPSLCIIKKPLFSQRKQRFFFIHPSARLSAPIYCRQ